MKKKGSVTIFSAIIYLVLVSFALGIIEAYRIQYLYAKQEQISRLAIHNMQADYSVDIFEEYGLLFYDETSSNRESIMKNTFETGFQTRAMIHYFQDFLNVPQNKNKYYRIFEAADYEYKHKKQELVIEDFRSAQKEAILFVRDKIPFILAEPWLEKIKVWQKSQKAEEWLKKKEEVLKDFVEADNKALKLYLYLDGVEINARTNQAMAIRTGVNHFCTTEEEKYRKQGELQKQGDLPDQLRNDIMDNFFSAETVMTEAESLSQRGIAIVDGFLPFPKEWNFIQKARANMELSRELEENRKEFEELRKKYGELIFQYENAERMAGEILEHYEDSIPKLKDFLAELEKADISHLIKTSIRHEVESVLQRCDVENSLSRIGNFKYLKEKLAEEKADYLKNISFLSNYCIQMMQRIRQYENSIRGGKEWEDKGFEEGEKAKEDILKEESHFYFPMSYQGYSESQSTVKEEDLRNHQKKMDANIDSKIEESLEWLDTKIINENHLPSKLIEIPSGGSFAVSGSQLERLVEAFQNVTDEMLLNEYYFQVFSHFALQSEDELAISGYAKSAHARKGELEYLLFGDDEGANQLKMVGALFAARIAFNIIALLSDATKMAFVQSLATTIAGWWSLGAGSVVLTGIIVTLWASLETSADIFMLFRGKRVPMIKTPNTWYTSFAGGLANLALESVDAVAEEAERYLEKGVERFSQEINQATSGWATDLRYHLDNGVSEQVRQIHSEIAYLQQNVQAVVKEGLAKQINGYENAKHETKQKLLALGLSEKKADEILNQTFGKIENEVNERIQKNYTEKIEKIEEVLSGAQSSIEEFLAESQEKAETALKKKIFEIGEDVKKMGKKQIKKHRAAIKEKISRKLENKPANNNTGKKDIREYIGMNYVDYLRLFLLVDFVSDDVKWLRAMDLIQQNKQLYGQDFYLLNCERKFRMEVEATYQPLFFRLGDKIMFSEWLEDKYRIKTVTEGGYE